jgi:hypothetical protein
MNSKIENIRPKTEIVTFTALLGQLANNLAALIHNEIELMTQGIREKAGVVRSGVVIVAIGAVIGFVGVLSLCAALIIGLTNYMSPASAALVTGAALALIGSVFAYIGYKQLQKSILSIKEENINIETEDRG